MVFEFQEETAMSLLLTIPLAVAIIAVVATVFKRNTSHVTTLHIDH
jgi:hypothetical protein